MDLALAGEKYLQMPRPCYSDAIQKLDVKEKNSEVILKLFLSLLLASLGLCSLALSRWTGF